MSRSNELPSSGPIPREIAEGLERKPIVLGETSIGLHFRNSEEIRDVQAIIGRTEETNPLSIGLAGRRLHGQFAYTPRDIWMVINSFDPEALEMDIKDLTDPERIIKSEIDSDAERALAVMGTLPPRLFEPLNTLARFLDQQQKDKANLAEINFGLLPWNVLRTTLWRRIFTPGHYQANLDKMTSWKHKDLFQRVHPRPAAFFPHINLVVFSLSESEYQEKHDIGEESGVEIITLVLSPFNNYADRKRYSKLLYTEGVEGYTPLVQEVT